MILIIYNQDTSKFFELQKKYGLPCDFTCNSKKRLKYLLDNFPNDDVEGYIAKDADQNPDFREMMDLIYIRKKKLYENNIKKYPNAVKIHDVFAEKILVGFQKFYTP